MDYSDHSEIVLSRTIGKHSDADNYNRNGDDAMSEDDTLPPNRNIAAFLDMLAYSEIGPALLTGSDNGYNVIVGSTPANPILFTNYSQHPRQYQKAQNSDAAGRYQFMGRYWDHYKVQLALPDFGHDSQDKWAIQLIRECHAVQLIQEGRFPLAVEACRSRWASLPGAGYNQHENSLAALTDAYTQAGGSVA